jgi:hypothetical protein
MCRLAPSRPFSRVGLGFIIPCSSIPLSVTFRTPENYRMESIVFDASEVNLPFNAFLGWPTLYQFMAVAHYGHLVLKMSSSNGIIKVCGDHSASISTLEKLQALVVAHEADVGHGGQDQVPSSSRQHGSASAPHVHPSDNKDIPMKVIQIGMDAT